MQGRSSRSQDGDFLFSCLLSSPLLSSPTMGILQCKPALIAATLEQLHSTNRTVRLETKHSSLGGINKMMEFDFMTYDVA